MPRPGTRAACHRKSPPCRLRSSDTPASGHDHAGNNSRRRRWRCSLPARCPRRARLDKDPSAANWPCPRGFLPCDFAQGWKSSGCEITKYLPTARITKERKGSDAFDHKLRAPFDVAQGMLRITIVKVSTACANFPMSLTLEQRDVLAPSTPSDGTRPVIPSECEGSEKDFSLRSK